MAASTDQPTNLDALGLQPVVQHACEATEADALMMTATATGSRRFHPVAAHGLSWDRVGDLHAALEDVDVALERGELVNIPDLATDSRTSEAIEWSAYGFQSLVSVPLVWEHRVVGGIHTINPGIPVDTQDATTLLRGLARHAAVVVVNLSLSSKAARLSREVESVLALDEVVLSARDVQEMERRLLETVAPLTGALTGGIMVWDKERNVLRMLPGAFGVEDDDAVSCQVGADHPTSNSARVFATGKSYLSNDTPRDPAHVQDYVALFHVERLLTVPLSLGRRRIGVLHLANKPTPFTQDDLQTAEMLAPRIATVVELGQAVFRLHRHQRLTAALVDMAVGIASGGTMQELAPRILARIGHTTGVNALGLVFNDGRPILWHSGADTRLVKRQLLMNVMDQERFGAEVVTPRGAGDPGHSTIRVPVRLEGAHVATLLAVRNRAEPFVDHERDGFVRLANLTALAWATERNREKGAELARLRERQRIADDLHDTVAQILFAAQVNLESVLESGGMPPTPAKAITHTRGLLVKGDAEIRNVIHQLSPPIEADLAKRLASLVEELQADLTANVRLAIPSEAAEAARGVRQPVADAIVKTAREAIINANKHAAPSRVSVRLEVVPGGRLRLSVTDDGTGIVRAGRSQRDGHGLAAVRRVMREHGGLVNVGRGPSGGTRLTATVEL